MPIYDFQCTLCGKIFEEIVSSDVTEIRCKECKSGDAIKIFRGTRFIPFKPYVEYNLGDVPIEITSKRHLEDELKKRGLAMDNKSLGVSKSKTKREELRKKAQRAKEYINATT